MTSAVVNPREIAAGLTERWSPRVIGEVDDAFVKVAKVQGEFMWHSHDDEDELFFILDGVLHIELEDRVVTLRAGEMFVVPKGVRHRPVAPEECLVMLLERKSTRHTGNEVTPMTRSIDEQRRPIG